MRALHRRPSLVTRHRSNMCRLGVIFVSLALASALAVQDDKLPEPHITMEEAGPGAGAAALVEAAGPGAAEAEAEAEGLLAWEHRASFWQWFLSLVGGSWLGGGGGGGDVPEPALEPAKDCQPCECGVPNKKNRIVGGYETQVNEFPWVAKLFYRGRFYCAGSLINSKYVLTASHCLHGFDVKQVSVRLLEHDAGSESEAPHMDFQVKYAVKHQRYSESSFNNDVALLRLDGEAPLGFKGLLRPVCLPPLGRNFTGERGVAAGWGTTAQGGSVSPVLREVEVPILSNAECRRSGYGSRRITDNMLCAGYPDGRKDSCQGDSGGPLHVNVEKHMCVAGVVSWGDGCARPNYPGVYSRVNRYLTWLQAHTMDACACTPTGGPAPAPAPAPAPTAAAAAAAAPAAAAPGRHQRPNFGHRG